MKRPAESENRVADRLEARCSQIARGASVIVVAIGLLVLVGWLFDLGPLMSILPGLVGMKANTAFALCCGGLSLFFHLSSSPKRDRRMANASSLLAVLVGIIALLTLSEYVGGFNLGIDQFLFLDHVASNAAHYPPGRMAPISAFNLLALALALVFLRFPRRIAWVHALAGCAALTSLLAIVGYFYGVVSLYQTGQFTAVALHTAIAFLILCIGLWCATSRYGFMQVLVGLGTSGKLLRRYSGAALISPFLFDWLQMEGERYRLFGPEFGSAFFAMANVLALAALVWFGARSMRTAERKQSLSAENLRRAHATLEERVSERTGELVTANASLLVENEERKRAEETLRESEEKFVQLAANIGDVFYITSADLQEIQYVSPAYEEVWGRSIESLYANPLQWGEAILPDDRETAFAAFAGLMADKTEITVEYRIARPDGTTRWILSHGFQIRDASGKAVRISGVASDITERKLAEVGVLESKRFLQSTLDALSSHIAILDELGNIIEVNGAWNRFADENQSKNQLRGVGDNYLHLCDAACGPFSEEAPGMAAGIRAVISAERETFELEYPCHGPSEERWFVARVTRFVGDGRVRVVVAHENISARKRAEAEVRQGGKKLEAIINSVEGIVWETDGATRQVNFVSQKAEEILGYPVASWLGEPGFWSAHLHPDDREKTMAFSSAGAMLSRPVELEYRMLAADGRTVWFRDSASFISGPGQITVQRGLMLDITERKREEAELRAISEIMQGVITTNNLDELLALAHRSIGQVLCAENCFVGLHEAATDLIHFEFWLDKFDPICAPVLIGTGLSSYVLRTGQPLLSTKNLKQRLFEQGEVTQSGSDSASWIGVPLRTPARTIGVLVVQDYERENAYTQRDLDFLATVGDQIAIAIERKRAEEKLQLSEEKLEAAQQIAHVGSWECNLQTKEVTWSDEQYRLLGFAPGEVEPTSELFFASIHPDDRAAARRFVATVIETKQPASIDLRVVDSDGGVRILDRRAEILVDDAGYPFRLVGTTQDVTELRQKETALAASEERTRLIIATAHDAFLGMDSAGLINDWNPRAEATFGWSRAEAVGQAMHDLIIPPKYRDLHVQALKHFLATGEGPVLNKLVELSALHRDGHEMPIEMMISPIRLGDSFIFSASVRDITERKRAEAELQVAKETAEAASKTKSEFLANMSHEIRTPMNGIIGMTDLALETDLNQEQRGYLGMVKSSANSLLGLIGDILDFSKIEAGKLELETIDFSLRDCIGGMLKPLGVRADQKGLELVADIAPDVPDEVVGDPLRLCQILINLTANAIKFTAHGEIVVKATNQTAPNGGSHLHFSVSDTGIGIPAEKQGAVFEAFAQADGSTTRNYGGTGLGLSIASQLIEKMGGRIWMESEVGVGTTFHFTVFLGFQGGPASTPNAEARQLEGLRALAVDDNAVNRGVLEGMLLNWRMRPVLVESGVAALAEMARANAAHAPYELLLLDATMPGMDGFSLVEKIQAQDALVPAIVMMLPSATPGGNASRCSALGIGGWLAKPVTHSDLLDAVLHAIHPAVPVSVTPLVRQAAVVQAPSPGLRILVAEDNVINRAVVAGILEKQGHTLVHATTGLEALQAYHDGAFDLILMDGQMPEMDGFQATSRIREMEAESGGHIWIAAMTAHAMAGDRERCLAAGMDDYIAKPLRKEDLRRVLENYEHTNQTVLAHGRGPNESCIELAHANPISV